MSDEATAEQETHWISAAEAATQLKTSVRSVQRRCEKGTLRARQVQGKRGLEWEVDMDNPPEPKAKASKPGQQIDSDPTQAGSALKVSTAPKLPDAQPAETPQASPPSATTTTPQSDKGDGDARVISLLERENAFLRSQLEEANRNSGELRAALREALKVQPRQLTEGTKAANPPEVPASGTATQTLNQGDRVTTTATPAPSLRKEPRPLWKVMLGIR